MHIQESHYDLRFWLECEREALFAKFIEWGGERTIHRGTDEREFVYIPGTRNNKVLLIAHTDTVWDEVPTYPAPVRYENGIYRSSRPTQGIGADDRAGCAMLWHLRELGHSLLLTSGEEIGCYSSYWIMEDNADIADTLQTHQFMIQFDRQGAYDFKCYAVGTDSFRAYIEESTGYTEPNRLANTDVAILARDICGVNLSTGYYGEHTPNERLVMAEWEHTLKIARDWLAQPELPQFPLKPNNRPRYGWY